jgi:hypothetical protein
MAAAGISPYVNGQLDGLKQAVTEVNTSIQSDTQDSRRGGFVSLPSNCCSNTGRAQADT